MICINCNEREITTHTRSKLCNLCFERNKDSKRTIGLCMCCHRYTNIHAKNLCMRCYRNQWSKSKKEADPTYNFQNNVRSLISHSFKRGTNGFVKQYTTEQILGCSLKDFQDYIGNLFKDGMSFDNYGKWHLDHIIPISQAKTEEEVVQLCHYTNFQPLWAFDNLSKGNKV